jgi:hypothetical protein
MSTLDTQDVEVLPRKLYRIEAIAKDIGIDPTTLHQAAMRGDLSTFTTGCKMQLTTAADVRRWLLRRLAEVDTQP